MISRLLKIISAKVYERILPPPFSQLLTSLLHIIIQLAIKPHVSYSPLPIYTSSPVPLFDSTSVTKQKEQENRQVFLSLFIKLFLYNKPP